MRLRALGRTGIEVSELTVGTRGLAQPGYDADEARAALALAFDHGVNGVEIDAADDAAVALLGDVLRRRVDRDPIHVFARATSLVCFDLPSPHVPVSLAYPGRALRRQTEALLSRLGIERLALLQLHAWCPEWLDEGDWRAALDRLRMEGKIAGIGISLFDHDADAGIDGVARGAVDAVQLMRNLFDPGGEGALLPLCHRQGVGVIARAPLYHGALAWPSALAGDAIPVGDWRRLHFYPEHREEALARVERLAGEFGEADLAGLALRFTASHPAISTIVLGLRTGAHVERCLAAIGQGPLCPEQLARLAVHRWLC